VAGLHRAQKLDPLLPIFPAWQGWCYFWMERYDEAIIEAEKSLELVSDFPIGLAVLGLAYSAKGMYEQAIDTHQKMAAINPDLRWALGHTYALAGRRDEALAVVAELENQSSSWFTWGIAGIYTALDKKNEAFYWLEKAYQKRHPYILWLKCACIFNSLREDPRYKDLARRLNLPE